MPVRAGLPVVFVILIVEGFLMLPLAWYLEQVLPTGTGVRRHPLFFLRSRKPRSQASGGNSGQVNALRLISDNIEITIK